MKTKILVIAVIFLSSFSFLACEKDEALPDPSNIQDPINEVDTFYVDSVIPYDYYSHTMHGSNFTDFNIEVTESNISEYALSQWFGNPKNYFFMRSDFETASDTITHKIFMLTIYDPHPTSPNQPEGGIVLAYTEYGSIHNLDSIEESSGVIIERADGIYIYDIYKEVLTTEYTHGKIGDHVYFPKPGISISGNSVWYEDENTENPLEIFRVNGINEEYLNISIDEVEYKIINSRIDYLLDDDAISLRNKLTEMAFVNNTTDGKNNGEDIF